MKRFEVFYKNREKNNCLLNSDGTVYAIEVAYIITAETEERALELLTEQGLDSDDYYLEQTHSVRDQMGNFYPESIQDARIAK